MYQMSDNRVPNERTLGILYVVATPIGNLGDMSARAREVLSRVRTVLAEDTRDSRRLLSHFGIQTPLKALHEHNESERLSLCIQWLKEGDDLALICDAGTPLINDPGYRLVAAAREAGIRVSPVPGASSPIAALSVSGLPTDRFVYDGFLPAKGKARLERLRALDEEARTLIFLESSHRLEDTLGAMTEVWPRRRLVLAKELTKIHEAVISGNAAEILHWLADDPARIKGEFVLMTAGAETSAQTASALDADHVLRVLLEALPASKAAKAAAQITGLDRKTLYQRAMQLQTP